MANMPTTVNRVPRLGYGAQNQGKLGSTPYNSQASLPAGRPPTLDFGGVRLQNNAAGQAATTPFQQWTPGMHEAVDPGAAGRQEQRGFRNAQANALSSRNMGIGGYGGMGGLSEGAATRQAQLINPLLEQARMQNSRGMMTGTQRGLVDNHGRIMGDRAAAAEAEMQIAPPPKASFAETEGGRGVQYLPQNGTAGGIDQSRFIEGQRTPYGSQVVNMGGGRLGLIGAGLAGEYGTRGEGQRQALSRATSQAETARIAKDIAARGGMSLNGQYEQRQKDIRAMRGAARNPNAPAVVAAMGRMNDARQRQALAMQERARMSQMMGSPGQPFPVDPGGQPAAPPPVMIPNPQFSQSPFEMAPTPNTRTRLAPPQSTWNRRPFAEGLGDWLGNSIYGNQPWNPTLNR